MDGFAALAMTGFVRGWPGLAAAEVAAVAGLVDFGVGEAGAAMGFGVDTGKGGAGEGDAGFAQQCDRGADDAAGGAAPADAEQGGIRDAGQHAAFGEGEGGRHVQQDHVEFLA